MSAIQKNESDSRTTVERETEAAEARYADVARQQRRERELCASGAALLPHEAAPHLRRAVLRSLPPDDDKQRLGRWFLLLRDLRGRAVDEEHRRERHSVGDLERYSANIDELRLADAEMICRLPALPAWDAERRVSAETKRLADLLGAPEAEAPADGWTEDDPHQPSLEHLRRGIVPSYSVGAAREGGQRREVLGRKDSSIYVHLAAFANHDPTKPRRTPMLHAGEDGSDCAVWSPTEIRPKEFHVDKKAAPPAPRPAVRREARRSRRGHRIVRLLSKHPGGLSANAIGRELRKRGTIGNVELEKALAALMSAGDIEHRAKGNDSRYFVAAKVHRKDPSKNPH